MAALCRNRGFDVCICMEKLPNRKPNRLRAYDYSQNGAYFLTVCTEQMRCLLSTVTADQTPESARIVLTGIGEAVDQTLREMNDHYRRIRLDHYTIMPNHVHLLISIADGERDGAPRSSPPTNALSCFMTAFKKFSEKACGQKLWQRGFYDHIIRDDEDYRMHKQYIDENPKKWIMGKDAYYGHETDFVPPKP